MEMHRGVIKDLKKGKLVMIEGEPCRVVGVQISKPGKHGSAKARVDAISLFSGSKKTLLKPADADIEIPIIERKTAQIIALMGDKIQLMDLQTYETFELEKPDMEGLEPGKEVEVQEVMGAKTIVRVK